MCRNLFTKPYNLITIQTFVSQKRIKNDQIFFHIHSQTLKTFYQKKIKNLQKLFHIHGQTFKPLYPGIEVCILYYRYYDHPYLSPALAMSANTVKHYAGGDQKIHQTLYHKIHYDRQTFFPGFLDIIQTFYNFLLLFSTVLLQIYRGFFKV